MSVYLLSAIRRERQHLAMVADKADELTTVPPAIVSLLRWAQQDLAEADYQLEALLDATLPHASSVEEATSP